MNKRQIIDDIREINKTVPPQFLAQFNETALGDYLNHLKASRQRHATISRVIRPAVTGDASRPAVAA